MESELPIQPQCEDMLDYGSSSKGGDEGESLRAGISIATYNKAVRFDVITWIQAVMRDIKKLTIEGFPVVGAMFTCMNKYCLTRILFTSKSVVSGALSQLANGKVFNRKCSALIQGFI